MESKELRIGNKIKRKGDDYTTFEVVEPAETNMKLKDSIGSYFMDPSDVDGIELTDQILLRSGVTAFSQRPFKAWITRSQEVHQYVIEYTSFHPEYGYIFSVVIDDVADGGGARFVPLCRVQYVHHLQNLWYDLTGETLKIVV